MTFSYNIKLTDPITLKRYPKGDEYEIGVYSNPRMGIYFLWDNNEIVYIGKSTDLLSRITEHSRNRNITYKRITKYPNKIYTHFSFIFVDEPSKIHIAEPIYIDKFKPKYNNEFKVSGSCTTYIEV